MTNYLTLEAGCERKGDLIVKLTVQVTKSADSFETFKVRKTRTWSFLARRRNRPLS